MTRKLLVAVAIVASLCAVFFVPSVSAQGEAPPAGCMWVAVPQPTPDGDEVVSDVFNLVCNELTPHPEYPVIENLPAAAVNPILGAPVIVPSVTSGLGNDIEPAEPSATSDPDLAHSGSESFVLLYIGTGLVAFGAVALGSRRRLFVDD